jgi:NADH-quinone oxidoreductase subunit C
MSMDNKKETEVLKKISSKFNVKGKIQREKRVWINIKKENLTEICNWLKKSNYNHLSAISVTDWLEEGFFELTYHIWSYKDKVLITLKTKIDRKKPFISSVVPIWKESAQIHERELHELFGVKFEGNKDLTPLFLEDWKGMPPFRKDFNLREYVRDELYDKENERERPYYE